MQPRTITTFSFQSLKLVLLRTGKKFRLVDIIAKLVEEITK